MIEMVVFLNGMWLDQNEAKISVFDHGFLYGDGCFETLRTYQGKIFRLNNHLERLQFSCKQLKIDYPWKNDEIKEWIEKLLQKNNLSEARIRITITRGINEFNFCGASQPTILITATALIPLTSNTWVKGVTIETLEIERILPQIKSLNLLPSVLGQQIKKEKDVFETVFVNQKNKLTEGTVSNFFIIQNGKIVTAPKAFVLSGITREVVKELADKLRISFVEKLFGLEEVFAAQEAFLTSTIMDIVPVIKIGKTVINQGKVGAITRQLMDNFQEYVLSD